MSDQNDGILSVWMQGKTFLGGDTTKTEAELKDFIEKNEKKAKDMTDTFKVFSRDCLSEFSKIRG